jgi:hypothetical protein
MLNCDTCATATASGIADQPSLAAPNLTLSTLISPDCWPRSPRVRIAGQSSMLPSNFCVLQRYLLAGARQIGRFTQRMAQRQFQPDRIEWARVVRSLRSAQPGKSISFDVHGQHSGLRDRLRNVSGQHECFGGYAQLLP